MAKEARERAVKKSRTVSNEVVYGIAKKDITVTVDFGCVEIVLCNGGAMFRTHTGFHIWTAPWVMTMEGKSETNNLYQWLLNLVEMKHETEKHPNDIFPVVQNEATYEDMLEGMKLLTISNLMYPVTAFVDVDEAAKFAHKRLDWLTEMSMRLEEAASQAKEETEDDLRKNFEHGQQAVMDETVRKILTEEFEGEEAS